MAAAALAFAGAGLPAMRTSFLTWVVGPARAIASTASTMTETTSQTIADGLRRRNRRTISGGERDENDDRHRIGRSPAHALKPHHGDAAIVALACVRAASSCVRQPT